MKTLKDMTELELKNMMNDCALAIDGTIDMHTGVSLRGKRAKFVLVIFDDSAIGQVIASCTRKDMILAIRKTADRLEGR